MLKSGMRYIEHETVTYTAKSGKTYTIYGSPVRTIYSPSGWLANSCTRYAQAALFYSIGAFQYSPGEGREIYSRIPPSVDILMTHTPALGICDLTKRGKHAGCPELAERLTSEDLRNCRLHVFGHIHEAHGVAVVGQCESNPDGRISVNAALPSIPLPIIVDLED